MALPRAARQFVKLPPIAFLPSIHRPIQPVTSNWMRLRGLRFRHTSGSQTCRETPAQVPLGISQAAANERVSWPVVSNTPTR
jgi:hypothetical protein